MLILNRHADRGKALHPADQANLCGDAAREVANWLSYCAAHQPTPLTSLPALARTTGIGEILVKDEGKRLGLNSFKALGGSYAVICLVLEEAERQLCRPVGIAEIETPAVREIARGMTFSCATDGNHGRSVAAGAKLVGARAVIYLHAGVSENRAAAIAHFGAELVRVPGVYDDAVAESARVCAERGWILLSDTSWPGYERIPGLVMKGYTAMLHEIVSALEEPPTHIFVQAGVGGLAAAAAGYFPLVYGDKRPAFIVVEPSRAACLFESARAGEMRKIAHGEPTVMAMLECYEPSMVAWRILSRCADAFMTVDEEDAVRAMRILAHPRDGDPAIVAGESGGAGLAGLMRAAQSSGQREALGLGRSSRVLVINTEGATDPARYHELVGTKATEPELEPAEA
jgi:diaminopropionate ammonia-lyase